MSDAVHFLGEREDVPEILAALDLLLVPSWQEPFGRTVIEGMAMGRVVLATIVGGPREIIEDGVDGRLLAPREPRGVGGRRRTSCSATGRDGAHGAAARASAERFDRDRYVGRDRRALPRDQRK